MKTLMIMFALLLMTGNALSVPVKVEIHKSTAAELDNLLENVDEDGNENELKTWLFGMYQGLETMNAYVRKIGIQEPFFCAPRLMTGTDILKAYFTGRALAKADEDMPTFDQLTAAQVMLFGMQLRYKCEKK